MPEIFESSTVSSILSWLMFIPTPLLLVIWLFTLVAKHKGVPWLITAWLGLCILVLSPARYLLWMTVTAECFCVQSFRAFFSGIVCLTYVPIVIGIMFMIGVGIPLASLKAFFSDSNPFSWTRGIMASISLPIICIITSSIFYWALPCAGWTVHWLQPRDVIRATNGPSTFMWKYVTSQGTPVMLPDFFHQTPMTDTDSVRCHVSAIYMGHMKQGYFVDHQYPELFKKLISEKP